MRPDGTSLFVGHRTRVIDLFAGPGGLDVGARRLGIDPLGIEWDDAACATRRAAGLRTLQADVAALDPRMTLAQHFGPGAACDGMAASAPCQAFSTTGKRRGHDDIELIECVTLALVAGEDQRAEAREHLGDTRSILVLEPLRWALALRPRWVVWEQVPPVLSFWEFCAPLLRDAGYDVWTGCLSAEAYGVPQTRKRAFLIARLDGVAAPPAPTHSRYYPRDPGRLDLGVAPWISMGEALGWGDHEGHLRSNYGTGGDASKRGERELSQPAPTLTSKADRMKWVLHTKRDQRADGSRQTMSRDRPAPTLTAKSGGQWVFRRPATTVNCDPRISKPGRHDPTVSGPQQAGAIRVTAEEAAVLQSFPPDYPFQGTKTKQFEQIGNAVPPLLAAHTWQAATGLPFLDMEVADAV